MIGFIQQESKVYWETKINRYKKITLIENVNRSIRKLLQRREIIGK